MIRLLYAAFFLSGLAGLVYETIWSRYLALLVGHSAYAQVIVLTIFLGGLSAGALIAGGYSERVRKPLVVYAVVELVVGVMGLLFHPAFTGMSELVFGTLLPTVPEGFGGVVRWSVAGLLLLPQSVLLGTTFPLMSAALLRRTPDRPGATLAILYFLNSFGAAIGALVAGFVLIGAVGLPGTVAVAGTLNLVVALVALVVARDPGVAEEVVTRPAAVTAEAPGGVPPELLWRAVLGLAFGTAVASFIYEIVWIRMLALVLGSATHAFELMLSAFILGIALGALYIERRADGLAEPVETLAVIQWIMGFAALATLPVYVASFEWTAALVSAVQPTDGGYTAFNLARYGIALAVMLPSTFCAGMVLPLATRMLVVAGKGERAVGWVYGINTLGSIVGVSLAALVLLPILGVKYLLLLGAGLDMALGVGLLHLSRSTRGGQWARMRRLGWAGTAVVLLGVGMATHLDPLLLSGGVFRTGRVPGMDAEVLFYEDGRTATVSVIEAGGWRVIATNGKTDASVRTESIVQEAVRPHAMEGDEPTQLLLALLALAYHDDPQRMAIVGQGSGVTSHYMLADPDVRSLVTIEIEPEMIEGSRAFYPANRRVFDDPRSRFLIDDARAVLEAEREPFDVIVSEPSNPWVSGVASLFTTEFYGRVKERLAPGGHFVQWIQVYEISDELVLTVLAALHEHFPAYEVYRSTGDLIVVATPEPELPDPDWSVLDLPDLQADLARAPTLVPAYLSMLRVANREALAPLLERWPVVNSDFEPVLDLGAERARFRGEWASGLLFLGAGPLHVVSPHLPPQRTLAPSPAPFPEIQRSHGLALNTRLREALAGDASQVVVTDPALADRIYDVRRFRAAMSTGRPPGDWLRWTREAQRISGYFHEGLTGVADQGFFDELNDYLDRAEAPRAPRAAIDFLRDAHAWAFRGASEAGLFLVNEVGRGRDWLSPDVLLDGLVTSLLRTDQVERAVDVYSVLRPRSARGDGDLRLRLLEAHLDEAVARRTP